MNYQRILAKCKAVVFPDSTAADSDDYYIASGRGMPICSADYIRVDNANGIEEKIPWSLETYIKLSCTKYLSKARFYCVKKPRGIGHQCQ